MPLSEQDRTTIQHDVRRIEEEIRSKEAILASYKQDPSKKHLIPGLENEITGLK